MNRFFCKSLQIIVLLLCFNALFAQQTDTLPSPVNVDEDSVLRITNINPYITLHVDSMLWYKMNINKPAADYYWFLKNAPLGLKINEQTGLLSFKAEKKFFLSGKLKYDEPYKVSLGVQNLHHPSERVDTTITITFYNTEIIASRVKPSVGNLVTIDEGDTLQMQIQCEHGSFPIEQINFSASYPIKPINSIKKCDDYFSWSPGFDFVKESDSGKVKIVMLYFIGTTRFKAKDTAVIKLIVKDALNYPQIEKEHALISKNINNYLLQLKYMFQQLDKNIKKNKNTRTTFDLTSATTALSGTILATSSSESAQNLGKVLPSVGVTLVPVKEAVAPAKVYDQNQATLIRTAIKRLEYVLNDNVLVGEKDSEIVKKTNKLREELKQTQVQLIDVPLELVSNLSEDELNEYFNSPKVKKKYQVSKNK